ncbi:MAG: hypothetical protein JSS65_03160 [Armatimonadetes bacterium]|nr:hypothetical protein [Armatimonadota bacterium]
METEFVKIVFQHGPADNGVNGCRIEDVIELLQKRLLDHQGRGLACEENATALFHLDEAREALILRLRRREQQGVLNTGATHKSSDLTVSNKS